MLIAFRSINLFNASRLTNNLLRQRPISVSAYRNIVFHDTADKSFRYTICYGSNAVIKYKQHPTFPNVIDLYETFVPREFRGQGIAYKVAKETFDLLQEKKQVKVIVSCPYLVEFLHKNPQYSDTFHTDT